MRVSYSTVCLICSSLLLAAAVSVGTLIYTQEEPKIVSLERISVVADTAEGQAAIDQLRYERDVASIRADLLDSQSSWFEILISAMIGLFGVLISVIVIYFAFRFGNAAVA